MYNCHTAEGALCFQSDQMRMYLWVSLDDGIVDPRMQERRVGRQSAW